MIVRSAGNVVFPDGQWGDMANTVVVSAKEAEHLRDRMTRVEVVCGKLLEAQVGAAARSRQRYMDTEHNGL